MFFSLILGRLIRKITYEACALACGNPVLRLVTAGDSDSDLHIDSRGGKIHLPYLASSKLIITFDRS